MFDVFVWLYDVRIEKKIINECVHAPVHQHLEHFENLDEIWATKFVLKTSLLLEKKLAKINKKLPS